MPREGDRHDRWRAKKKQESTKLKEDKKLCETEWCFQIIWSWEQYCDPCKLNRFPEKYAKSCRAGACWKKTLDEYCDQHNKTCVSCDSRNLVENSSYCNQHCKICITWNCLVRTADLYCETHQREQRDLGFLVRQKTSLPNPQEVVQFNTWWNNNCATVINGNSSYTLWVLVYEPAIRNKAEILQKFEINFGYDRYSLSSTQNKASSIRSELNGENPILAIHPSANSYVSFSSLITSPYVVKNEVGSWNPSTWLVLFMHNGGGITPSDLDGYFKPLDIVQIKQFERKFGVRFYHVGIYLGDVGNGKRICHFSRESNGVRLASWSEFLSKDRIGELYRYHPTIPFKNSKRMAEQIAWSVETKFQEDRYDLRNRNCEHFANMCVYGINYSKQVEDNKTELAASVGVPGAIVAGGFTGAGLWGVIGSIALVPATGGASLLLGATSVGAAGAVVATTLNVADGYAEINNGKGSTIKLINEMNESNNKLGERSNKLADDIKANIEVPPKEHCRIM